MTTLLDPPLQPDTDDRPCCTSCGWDDEDDLAPGINEDPYCGDCRQTFAGLEDQRGFAFI